MSATYASAGDHLITLSAHNCSALEGSNSITIHVVSGSGTPNTSAILSPADGSNFIVDSEDGSGFYKALALSGNATDSSGNPVAGARLRWTAFQGSTVIPLGTGNNPVAHLYNNTCGTLTFVIRMEVLDAAGNPVTGATRQIIVAIENAPC